MVQNNNNQKNSKYQLKQSSYLRKKPTVQQIQFVDNTSSRDATYDRPDSIEQMDTNNQYSLPAIGRTRNPQITPNLKSQLNGKAVEQQMR